MTTVRCKFVCESIADNGGQTSKRVRFQTRYCPEVPEDQRFTKWTPSGALDVVIDNPAAVAALRVGEEYYIDISPVPPAEPKET